jgi:hypothetical protein
MSEYDSLTSSARLLLLVGHAYLISPQYRPSFIVCVSASYSRLSCTAGLPYNAGIFRLPQVHSFCTLSLPGGGKKNISGTIRVSQVPQCFSSYMPRPYCTPADPPGSHHYRPLCFGFHFSQNVAICFNNITMLYHASGEHLSPCGLYDSLCTLRVSRSTLCLSFPITQHSVRVVG